MCWFNRSGALFVFCRDTLVRGADGQPRLTPEQDRGSFQTLGRLVAFCKRTVTTHLPYLEKPKRRDNCQKKQYEAEDQTVTWEQQTQTHLENVRTGREHSPKSSSVMVHPPAPHSPPTQSCTCTWRSRDPTRSLGESTCENPDTMEKLNFWSAKERHLSPDVNTFTNKR